MRSLVPTHTNGTHAARVAGPIAWDTDRLFDRLIGDFWGAGPTTAARPSGAPLDIIELDDSIRVSVEVPGIEPSDLDVSLTGQVLTLSAEKRDDSNEESGARTYSERQFGQFRRSIELPCPVEAGSAKAEHENGVITVMLQKSDAVRPKRISVETK